MYELDYVISKELLPIVDKIVKGYIVFLNNESDKRIRSDKYKAIENSVKCFVRNAYNAYRKKSKRFVITLDKYNYNRSWVINGKATGRKVSYTYTRKLITYLYNEDMIDLKIGGVKDYKYNFITKKKEPDVIECSFVVMNNALTEMFNGVEVSKNPNGINVIFLRNEDKRIMSFKSTPEVSTKREYLQYYNETADSYIVEVDGEVYPIHAYKIYNINLESGGKTYINLIQNLPKKERMKITINSKRSTAYDYSSFEASLAYCIKQEVMDVDPYSIYIEGYDRDLLRDITKHALLIMLNCNDKNDVQYILNSYIRDNYKIEELYKEGKIPHEYIQTQKIIKLIEFKNHKISDMFYGDNSGQLQNIGSLINDYVVNYMMQTYDCLVLQVFDEFIVDEEYGGQLLEAMYNGYEKITGIRENCKIKKEW